MTSNNLNKYNKEKAGIVIGLLLPLISILIYYFIENPGGFGLFLKEVFIYGIHTKVIGLTIIPNFAAYFIARLKKMLKTADGISIVSLIYLTLIVVLKYFT